MQIWIYALVNEMPHASWACEGTQQAAEWSSRLTSLTSRLTRVVTHESLDKMVDSAAQLPSLCGDQTNVCRCIAPSA